VRQPLADTVVTRSHTTPSLDVALAALTDGRGAHFDADVVDACLDLIPAVAQRTARAVSRGMGKEWGLSLYTAVIVKYSDDKTSLSTTLEDLLR